MSDNLKGAFITSLTALSFALNDALMKFIVVDMSLYQAIFLRALIVLPLVLAMAYYFKQLYVSLNATDRAMLIQRSLLETALTFLFVNALATLPLAVVVVVMQATPLCLTVGAVFVFQEQVGWRRWLATLIGFIGVIIIVKPGTEGFDANILYAIASVICLMMRDLLTRKMSDEVPPVFTVLWTAIATCFFAGLFMPFTSWTPLDNMAYFFLIMVSFTIMSAYFLSIFMMRIGDVGFVSQFRYTGILWAILLGAFLFDEKPDMSTLLGASLIAAAGIYSISRERQKSQFKPRNLSQ